MIDEIIYRRYIENKRRELEQKNHEKKLKRIKKARTKEERAIQKIKLELKA